MELKEDKWSVASGEKGGARIIYRYRSSIAENVVKNDYSTMIVISWDFDGSNSNGLPYGEINDRQQLLEGQLDWLDDPEYSYLTQVVTGNGRKEWLWYVKDCGVWMEKLNESLSKQPVFPIAIDFYDEPEWETYSRFVAWAPKI
ncbi:DUF695 domain-containing protein [Microbulbifer hainanensis]|uniref:DUF695 domain-containing protein n=1 Tax=Microbulbifer hainanensis TaxID=2735675 RepID=UPI0018663633|nr:DUF695 domain-containing protein [Microbulbifer hainanensis]